MANFSILIQEWFRQKSRNLPWRETKNPYYIWLSEVILQQTRVDQGINYYQKFVREFPTVKDLASAKEDKVLKLWQGLGYYSRARNLHFSAKYIVEHYDGVFPTSYKEVLGLKGVGLYTAAAISSIAHDLPYAVVDGNVYRVLSRYLGIDTPIDSAQGQKEFAQVAQSLLDENNAGNHNQAVMEIGALVCTPKLPKCYECPLEGSCFSYKEKIQLQFPVKAKKTKVSNRYFNYLVLTDGIHTVLKKRTGKGIWQGLYDFPLIEKKDQAEISTDDLAKYNTLDYRPDGIFQHILSHQKIKATFWLVNVKKIEIEKNQVLVKINDIEDYPLPQLLIRYMNSNSLINRD